MDLGDYLALRYTIELRRDEDGDWIARVRELKGCTADGPTMAAALEDLEQAKREWLTAAIEDGVPIPPPPASGPRCPRRARPASGSDVFLERPTAPDPGQEVPVRGAQG